MQRSSTCQSIGGGHAIGCWGTVVHGRQRRRSGRRGVCVQGPWKQQRQVGDTRHRSMAHEDATESQDRAQQSAACKLEAAWAWSAEAAWRQERAAYARGGRHAACGSQAAHLHLGDVDVISQASRPRGAEVSHIFWQFHRNSHRDAVLRKKSERYRSTPHYSRSFKMKSARFKKASEEIGNHEGRKASATAQLLTTAQGRSK